MQFRKKRNFKIKKGETERERRIFRIVAILRLLGHGQSFIAKELAVENAVSLRTVQRDVQLLECVGFPLIRGVGGRFSFMHGYRYFLPSGSRKAPVLERNKGVRYGRCVKA